MSLALMVREEWADLTARWHASGVAIERSRVVAYLRREAAALDECGLDGSAVAHLAQRIEQSLHVEDA